MKNILITSVGKRVALTRCFKESLAKYFPDGKVFTTDMNPEMAPAGYVSDECFRVPAVTDAHYPEILLNICEENSIGMIVATIDTELLLLSNLKDKFSQKGIHIIVGDIDFVSICRDKRNTGAFFESKGVRVPREIDKMRPTFPLFAKPYDGSLSANLHHIKCAEELTKEVLDDPKLLFMEYIDKKVYKEYTVDMYYGKDNRVKCIVPRERIEVRAGEINKGRTSKNKLLSFLKEHLDYIEGCVGCICVQLFYNPQTEDIVGIEINPRFGGGYPLTYMCGGNFPELLIKEYFLNEEIAYFDGWKDGLLMLRYDDAIFV
ncbi:MAG: ATP-grasp domain-containing protein [Tidjanibacter sp.]|nr:ATP-grasp domain-containing protein [Tidjanibacter sp.]